MPTLLEKLNAKGRDHLVVLNAPESFDATIDAFDGEVVRDPKLPTAVRFAIAFATTQDELDRASRALTTNAEGDALLWIAYPKQTSKRYRCEFNRDSGFDVLRSSGYDTVRQVAIDDDWSALRFRKQEFIGAAAKKR